MIGLIGFDGVWVDILFIGPGDLSQSYGIFPQKI